MKFISERKETQFKGKFFQVLKILDVGNLEPSLVEDAEKYKIQ